MSGNVYRASAMVFACILISLTAVAQTVEQGYIDVDNGKLYYEKAGTGEAIVLIHDGLVHSVIYDAQFPVLAEKYTVVRYDRRGYGKSPEPENQYSDVEDLKRIFDKLGIDKACVVGMSAGGGLAIDFTLQYPQHVSSLVVVGGVVSGFSYTEHMLTRGGHMPVEYYQDDDKLRKYITEDDPYEIYPENTEVKAWMKELINANPHNVGGKKHRLKKGPDRAALKNLHEISVPTLLIAGEYDIPDVHAHAGAIEAGIPGARRIITKNAGHLVPLEQPEEFNRLLLEFLGGEEEK